MAGWWFGTFFIFPYIGNNHPNWLIFFRGVQTTNQMVISSSWQAVNVTTRPGSSDANWFPSWPSPIESEHPIVRNWWWLGVPPMAMETPTWPSKHMLQRWSVVFSWWSLPYVSVVSVIKNEMRLRISLSHVQRVESLKVRPAMLLHSLGMGRSIPTWIFPHSPSRKSGGGCVQQLGIWMYMVYIYLQNPPYISL